MQTNNLLIELGTEELPPKALYSMVTALHNEIVSQLDKQQISYGEINCFATPRRLALKIDNLLAQQPDTQIEKKGPAVKAAFDAEGNPSKACQGFARSVNANISDLTEKAGYLYYTIHQRGKSIAELIMEILPHAIVRIPVPKRMRWGNKTTEFSRPVHWLLVLFGCDVIPVQALDLTAGRTTYGHRFHHPEAINLNHAYEYETHLHDAKVIASFEKRREIIKQQAKTIASKNHGNALINDTLLDEVTGLVEWPVALQADFSSRFLDVPTESLITAMEQHQKSFALFDQHNKLLPHFITVSNIESKQPERVKKGNERVMHARLSDAEFFFQTDLKIPLATHIEKLKSIIFQKKLGSLYDKTQRIKLITQYLAKQLNIDSTLAIQTAELAKTDLVTNMVGEFPELQGIMGFYYAKHEGLAQETAIALKEQYMPRFATDNLPESTLGAILAIADRIDTLVGIFGINQAPTGEKDPFALRRAALGILKICIEKNLNINLWQLIEFTVSTYQDKLTQTDTQTQSFEFILERLRAYFNELGISGDVFAAVHAQKPEKPLDFANRVKAIQHFKTLPDAQALAAANKRVSRILQKEAKAETLNAFDANKLTEQAEIILAKQLQEKQHSVQPLFQQHNYQAALTMLAELRPAVDNFFDSVLVMDENLEIKNNRLCLLNQLRELFLQVADISLLQA